MILTFLGTGTSQGVPVITCDCNVCKSADHKDRRLRCSAMLNVQGKTLVFDAGPDFRQQMLRENVQNVDAILLTHEHKDHVAGLDDIRPYNFRRNKPMDLYMEERVKVRIEEEFSYVFAENKYPGVPEMLIHVIENKPFEIEGIEVIPIRVLHYKLPIFSFRIQTFAYLTDVSYIDDCEKKKLRNLDVLVVNALRHEEHYSHFNLEQALQLVSELKPKRTYLTHISHLIGLYKEIAPKLPQNVFYAYDGLKVTI